MRALSRWSIAIAAVALSAVPLVGQALNLGVVSRGCRVALSSGQSQQIRAGTAVPNGYQLSVAHPRGASATSTLGVTRAGDAYELTLHDHTTYYAAAATVPYVDTFLDISLDAPRTGQLRLDVSCTWAIPYVGSFSGSGSLSVAGQTILQASGYGAGSATTSRVLDIGPNPVVLQLSDQTVLSSPIDIQWTLRLTPVEPCAVTTFGPRCGADLVVEDDLLHFAFPRVTLVVQGQPTAGLLIAGFQPRAIPVGPCTLLNEALVALPFGGRFYLDPPRISGYAFVLQGAARSSGQLAASAGLEFVCR